MRDRQKQLLKSIILLGIGIFSIISLVSYDSDDVAFVTSSVNPQISNLAGRIGAYFAWFLYTAFGYCAYLFPLLAFVWTYTAYTSYTEVNKSFTKNIYSRVLGTIILFVSLSSLLSLFTINNLAVGIDTGGISGVLLSRMLYQYFGAAGSYIIVLILVVLSMYLAAEFLVWTFFAKLWNKLGLIPKKIQSIIKNRPQIAGEKKIAPQINISKPQVKTEKREKSIGLFKRARSEQKNKKEEKHTQPLTAKSPNGEYNLPSLDLLEMSKARPQQEIKGGLQANANTLEETLMDFGIEAKVVQVDSGPVVTRYELQPAAGVKIQKIVSLSNDIALGLKAMSVRVVAPIPGKDRVGIEVPNSKKSIVCLREILKSDIYKEAASKLTLAVGKDITGTPIVCDLGITPHLLIAGATGSGKTVCVNSIITSFLFRARPDEIKFIMVDPKMVELAPFNGIPHLLAPVITKPKKVSAALDWSVEEMENRYQAFAKEGARNIEMYNKKVGKDKKIPYIVLIIDELADLMAVASQKIENAITRLSQLSRAVGIHIILATQRPSVDVITGIIKANFPTRISFKVSSKVDSRTVLDANGADKLIGNGDMLFLPPGSSKLIRVQAPLVTDVEIDRVVKFIKDQKEPSYNEEILERQEKATKFPHRVDKKDEMYEDAVRVVLETNHASVSMLQRRLALGYTRAARLIDAMEQKGIVGTYRGSKPREILVDKQKYLRELDKGSE